MLLHIADSCIVSQAGVIPISERSGVKNISRSCYERIGIATTYGRPYYKFTKLLKSLDVSYDSILPDQIESYGGLIFTTAREAPFKNAKNMLTEEILELNPAVLQGIILQKLHPYLERNLVLGVDPGSRLGLSAYYLGVEIESALYSSVGRLVSHMTELLAGLDAKKRTVKIGNGDMNTAREIGVQLNIQSGSPFELEFVDERRTSRKIKNFNQRGKRDRLSARYITQREGQSRMMRPLSIAG